MPEKLLPNQTWIERDKIAHHVWHVTDELDEILFMILYKLEAENDKLNINYPV